MATTLHRSTDRGTTQLDWLDSKHSFSFGDYADPKRNGFGALLVLNEDVIKANSGFGMHSHRDMEIITIILEGEISHTDSIGNTSEPIKVGEIQRMSAGTGVTHSEMNTKSTPCHLLQLWIAPAKKGLTPSYQTVSIDTANLPKKMVCIASPSKQPGAAQIQQNASLYLADLAKGERRSHYRMDNLNGLFVFVIKGSISIGKDVANVGDSIEITDTNRIEITGRTDCRILLVDVPMK